jgi:hypothetical protein
MPYRVDLARLRGVVGSNDALLKSRLASERDKIEELDELFADGIADGQPSTAEAIDHLLSGRTLHPDAGAQYAYAVELICGTFGAMLDNGRTYPLSARWLASDVKPVLEQAGLPDIFEQLLDRGLPIHLPAPDDFPGTGFLEGTEIDAALDMLSKLPRAELDGEVAEVLDEVGDWLTAAKAANQALVCFYY